MPGVTDVVNKSLRLIGASPITSLTDGSTSANAADDIYTEVRDELLRSHPWNFATKRQQLARSATAPGFEFDYAYPLPSDWLRTISVHDNDAGHGTLLFREEIVGAQRSIVASADTIYLRYVYQMTDRNLMAADFRAALAAALARDMAITLTSSSALEERMTIKADRLLARARSADALGAFPELRPRGSWAGSRGGFHKDDFLSD